MTTEAGSLRARSRSGWLDRPTVLGYVLLTPTLVILAIFLAYPFVYGIWLALTNAEIGSTGQFVGLTNFIYLLGDPVYHLTVLHSFEYTFSTVICQFLLGLVLAAALSAMTRFSRLLRAVILLPYIVPSVLSTLAWLWMFNSTYSIINWYLLHVLGVHGPLWLSQQPWPLIAIIVVSIWQGVPFFGVLILAAMQNVPRDMQEAAAADGANAFQRWLFVTIPTIRPVILITTLLSVISNFSQFQVVWILTEGGPINETQIIGTFAYSTGIAGTEIGLGASIALSLFPVLAVVTGLVVWLLRRD